MRTHPAAHPTGAPARLWLKTALALCLPLLLAVVFAGAAPGAPPPAQAAAAPAAMSAAHAAGHSAHPANEACAAGAPVSMVHSPASPALIVDVTIQNYAFQPANLVIAPGTTVRWTNRDPDRHTVTSATGIFDSGEFDQGGVFEFTFTTPGAFQYFCARHANMTGTITVSGAATATPGATGTAATTGTPAATGTPGSACGAVGVTIDESGFHPATVTICPGATVTWTNTGTGRHRVRDVEHNLFDSDDLYPGQSFSYVFAGPGSYPYEDTRSSARGLVVVSGTPGSATPAASGTPAVTGTPAPTGTPGPGGVVDVAIIDESFVPANITIAAGTTVRWTHRDGDDTHTVTSPGAFNSGNLHNGDVFQWTFSAPGRFDYFCAFHSEMQGSVTVTGDTPTPTPASATPAAAVDIDIRDFAFAPAAVAVLPGATVRWTNHDTFPHTVTSDSGAFNSGQIAPGASFSFVFTSPGAFAYHCDYHPGMQGAITVTTGSGGTPTAQPTGAAPPSRTPEPRQTAGATGTAAPSATVPPGGTAGPTSPTPARTPTEIPSGFNTPTPPAGPHFTDVQPADYFYAAVNWLVAREAISGYADGSFRPGANITRGQITKVLVLAQGWALGAPAAATFRDVPPGSAFFPYVETAVAHGILSGYDDETFRPFNNVTRGQIAKIVALAHAWPLADPPAGTFSDVPPGSPFYPYIETAAAHSVLSGYADNTFRPANPATRGQAAKIIYNAR
jgi:plastocyanin